MNSETFYQSKIDLHMHSNNSDDGEFSVEELINKSKALNMELISITDHNSVKGLDTAARYGKLNSITVIPGIEIDCVFKSVNSHLLGYNIDFSSESYSELESEISEQTRRAFPEMLYKLGKTGLLIEADEVLKLANGKSVTGELIGEALLGKEIYLSNAMLAPYRKGGTKSDNPFLNFYRDFFSQGKAAYVPVKYPGFNDMKELILSSGGIPVLAHPGENFRYENNLVLEMIKEGIKGIEAFSNYHDKSQTELYINMAGQFGLIATCGSDFHGKNKPSIEIGKYISAPDEKAIIERLCLQN